MDNEKSEDLINAILLAIFAIAMKKDEDDGKAEKMKTHRTDFRCPICGEKLSLHIHQVELDFGIPIYMSFCMCRCGWRTSVGCGGTEMEALYEGMKNGKLCTSKCSMEPHWISVKDRMPKSEEYVLCYGTDGDMFVAKYLDYEDKWVEVAGTIVSKKYFTHWKPLPSPPSKDGDIA